jgi:hypothetical protein
LIPFLISPRSSLRLTLASRSYRSIPRIVATPHALDHVQVLLRLLVPALVKVPTLGSALVLVLDLALVLRTRMPRELEVVYSFQPFFLAKI